MKVAFFVLQDLGPPGVPCTDTVCVNYADKARSLVRRMLGQPTPKLPKHIQLRIESQHSSGPFCPFCLYSSGGGTFSLEKTRSTS